MVVGCQPFAGESMRWIKDTVTGLANPHDAAARNRVSKMEKYVMQGGDVNKPNKLGDTPLHEACAYIRDNGDSSKNRRRKGAVKDRRKIGKRLSRRQLGESGPLEMLELLLKAGSDINAQNIVGDAPLHKAAMNGRARAADYLICSGANVNIRNAFDQTPLHSACVSGNIEVVQRLVQGGADTSAQDAAEDTPFHEACRHQYEGIVIYLMGLVDNPDTSQALKLWRGLDPSWEQVLRSRAQARADDDQELGGKPVAVTAGTAAGLASVRLGVSTPSTTHNSLRSSESAMGLGLANRTPGQMGANGSRDRGSGGGGVTVSVRGSNRERKKTASPGASQARGSGHARARKRGSESPAGGAALGPDGAAVSSSTSVSRTDSATRRRRRDRGSGGAAEEVQVSRRPFSTGADADAVLDWQATKAKSVEQGRVIEKARLALREEQQEEAMAMSTTTQGDDDCSVDTLNTADTPTNMASSRNGLAQERREGRAPEQRKGGGGKASPAAKMVGASDVDAESASGSKSVGTATRKATTAAASRGGDAEETLANGGSPGMPMPTPPHTELKDVREHAPPREVGRRQSARKSKGQAIPLRSPPAQVSRRASGNSFPKTDNTQGTSTRRTSRRGSGSRSSSDRRAAAAGSTEGGQDAEAPRRRPGETRSSRSATDTASPGRSSAAEATALASVRPRRRSSREGDGDRQRGEGERRTSSSSSRRERHRQREGDAAPAMRSSPAREGDGSRGGSRRRHQSSRGEGGEPASGADGGRRTRSRASSRGSDHQGTDGGLPPSSSSAAAAAAAATAAAATAAAQPTSMVEAKTTEGAAVVGVPMANGKQGPPTPVPKAAKPPHVARTPRASDSLSAHFMTHGTKTREGRRTPARGAEGAASPSRNGGARERRTSSSSRISEGRPTAMAPKQRASGQDLCPPTWASDIPSELVFAAPRKKVVASDFPLKRSSPYSVRRSKTLDANGSPTRASAGLQFSSSPSVRKRDPRVARGSPARVRVVRPPEASAACASPARVNAEPQTASPSSSRKREAPTARSSPACVGGGPQKSTSPRARQPETIAACGSPALASDGGPQIASPSISGRPAALAACGSPARLSAGPRTPSPSSPGRSRCLSACGSPARVSSGPRNSASRPVAKTMDRRDETAVSSVAVAAATEAASSRPVAKAMDLGDDSDSEAAVSAVAAAAMEAAAASPSKGLAVVAAAIEAACFSPPPADAEGSSAAGAEADPSLHRSSREDSGKSAGDDVPPSMDALMMSKEAVSGGSASTQASEHVDREKLKERRALATRSAPGTTRKSFQTKAMALAKSKSVQFSDSDTESEDDRSSTTGASQHGSQVDEKLIAALSAVSKAFLEGRDDVNGAASTFDSSLHNDKDDSASARKVLDSESPSGGRSVAAASPAAASPALESPPPLPPPPPPPFVEAAAGPVVESTAGTAVVDGSAATSVETSAGALVSEEASEGTSVSATRAPMPPPSPPPYVEAEAAAAAVPSVENAQAGTAVDDDRAATSVGATAAASVDVKARAVVEPSAAPRIPLKALSSTTTLPFSTKRALGPALSATTVGLGLPGARKAVLGGGGRGLSSALGRPGTAPAKVTMPIAGGRAAWNKFLATTTPGEAEQGQEGTSVAATSSAEGRDENGDAPAQRDGAGGSVEGGTRSPPEKEEEEEEEHAPVVPERAPRGFKSAAEAQEGTNKGPAGAFSGNAMWRLAGNTTSAANRARSGIAANGHGGYSNPLAAMRAAGDGAASGTGAAGGSAMVNPLAGLRGAAGMGGAGKSNPLARGRGARPGGAGGTANPMLRGGGVGGGTASNPLARGGPAGGSAVLSPSLMAKRGALPAQPEGSEGSGGEEAPVAMLPLSSSGAATEVTPPNSDGVGEKSTAASPGSAGSCSPDIAVKSGPGKEGGAVESDEKRIAVMDGALEEDGPVEFRAIGNNGSWQRGGRMALPPRRPASVPRQVEADRDPGQAKVGGLVMALQKPVESSRIGLAVQDAHLAKVPSPSRTSLSVLGEQGLVQLRRVKYSPRHSDPAESSTPSSIFDAWTNDPGGARGSGL